MARVPGIEFLEQAVSQARQPGGRPFFVGVGFHQPHRPWHFPRQFWVRRLSPPSLLISLPDGIG